jgi:hypothetical protein
MARKPQIDWRDVIALSSDTDPQTRQRYEAYLDTMAATEAGQEDLRQIRKNTRFLQNRGYDNGTGKLLITTYCGAYSEDDDTTHTYYDTCGFAKNKTNSIQISREELLHEAYYDTTSKSYKIFTEEEVLRHELQHAAYPLMKDKLIAFEKYWLLEEKRTALVNNYAKRHEDNNSHMDRTANHSDCMERYLDKEARIADRQEIYEEQFISLMRIEENRAVHQVNTRVRMGPFRGDYHDEHMIVTIKESARPCNPVRRNQHGGYEDVVTGEKIEITLDDVMDRSAYDMDMFNARNTQQKNNRPEKNVPGAPQNTHDKKMGALLDRYEFEKKHYSATTPSDTTEVASQSAGGAQRAHDGLVLG